jgi:hypothetical protein
MMSFHAQATLRIEAELRAIDDELFGDGPAAADAERAARASSEPVLSARLDAARNIDGGGGGSGQIACEEWTAHLPFLRIKGFAVPSLVRTGDPCRCAADPMPQLLRVAGGGDDDWGFGGDGDTPSPREADADERLPALGPAEAAELAVVGVRIGLERGLASVALLGDAETFGAETFAEDGAWEETIDVHPGEGLDGGGAFLERFYARERREAAEERARSGLFPVGPPAAAK